MNWRDAPLHRVDFHLPSANVAGGLGAQYEYFSAQVEVKAFDATRANWIESLNLETEKIRNDLYISLQILQRTCATCKPCEKESLPF